ncbi:MAG: nucleotide-binding protein [Acidobacteriia bacterium]|nr:nucleotide-binding protein [Terriglobia bacterium]
MPVTIDEKLEELITRAWNTVQIYRYDWQARVGAFLRAAGLEDTKKEFDNIILHGSDWDSTRAALIGLLEGTAIRVAQNRSQIDAAVRTGPKATDSRKIFVVHGHDSQTKESVARFLERIGLEPVILHEQPSSGLTVPEKLEAFSAVGFAVILLTPDDIGGLASEPDKLNPRARQNVILELGYFLGKLSRRRVCALYKNIEIPSDYQGVLYVEYDASGGWRTKLAQELVEAGFSINLEALLKS